MAQPKRSKARTVQPRALALRPRRNKAHVFVLTHAGHRSSLGGRTGFDYPVVQEGDSAHFVVQYDPSLGPNGKSCADGVLATCENDYAQTSAWFGGIDTPTLPVNLIIAALDPSCAGDSTLSS